MPRWPRPLKTLLPLITVALLAAACRGTLPPARMALPEALQAAPEEPFDGSVHGREGRLTLSGLEVRFRRQGDRLTLFDAARMDRVSLQFEHAEGHGRCDGRRAEAAIGLLAAPVRPLTVECRFEGASPGTLTLRERTRPGATALGARDVREGEARIGDIVLALRSVHELHGSPLPLPQPAGYLVVQGTREVAALELAGIRPVLRRAAGLDPSTRQALGQVALALGLLLDPAVTQD